MASRPEMPLPNSDAILQRLVALHPRSIDLSLDRMHRLLDAIGNPEARLPSVVHIAGTNGKGSTLAMIRAGLSASGARCHAYTSPHLARFHERIRLAGPLISEPELAAVLDEVEERNGHHPITFFEITTAAALLSMSRVPAEWTLLEVGLGGRLDATNVIDPVLTVITPVSIDHQSYLGDTLAEIAAEKAGILKRGVTCIVARQEDAALRVIEERAARVGAPLLCHGQHWHVTEEAGRLVFLDETGLLDLPRPDLRGPHQIMNAGTAVAALRALGAPPSAAEAAMTAEWPARMQRLRRGPLVEMAAPAQLWLDGGHNPSAGEALAATLSGLRGPKWHLICGMLNTKDVAGYLRPLEPYVDSLFAVAVPDTEATLPAEATAATARAVGIAASVAEDPESALRQVEARTDTRILICGSLYLAGHVLRENA
jgi:dihydrofolate synthase/folylpolyglutamate synthase